MPGPGHGQHPALEHVRHGLCAAPHGHQRLVQPPHLPVSRAQLQADAVWDTWDQVSKWISLSIECWFLLWSQISWGVAVPGPGHPGEGEEPGHPADERQGGRGYGRDGEHQELRQQLHVRHLCFKPLDVKEIVEITERSLVYLQYIVLMKRLNLEADLTDDVKTRRSILGSDLKTKLRERELKKKWD